jgi:hypothetical protein
MLIIYLSAVHIYVLSCLMFCLISLGNKLYWTRFKKNSFQSANDSLLFIPYRYAGVGALCSVVSMDEAADPFCFSRLQLWPSCLFHESTDFSCEDCLELQKDHSEKCFNSQQYAFCPELNYDANSFSQLQFGCNGPISQPAVSYAEPCIFLHIKTNNLRIIRRNL